jgi:hypothetical protein
MQLEAVGINLVSTNGIPVPSEMKNDLNTPQLLEHLQQNG